jgi:hypothetical protein
VLGSPIRTPPDHSSVANSPGLIAGSYVLHRLLMPRHPPCALHSLSHKHSTKTTKKQNKHRPSVYRHHTPWTHGAQHQGQHSKTSQQRPPQPPPPPKQENGRNQGCQHAVAKMLASTIQFTRNTPTQANPPNGEPVLTGQETCLTADASGLNSVPTPTHPTTPPGSTPTPPHPQQAADKPNMSSTEKKRPNRPKHHRRFH